jgi:flagellar biosynthesis anti-sigma factor FlgM
MIAYMSSPKSKPRMGLIQENQAISEQLEPQLDEIKKYTEIAKNLPDIRESKVKVLRRIIESGRYKISPEATAEKIIELHKELCNEIEGCEENQ